MGESKANNTHFASQEAEILIMSNCIRWELVVLLHAAYAASLFPQTLFMETRVEVPRQAMELSQKIQITALETGIMDVLFDEGYIVFNRMISTKNKKSAKMMNREAVRFAVEQDVDLLLVLIPDERGALWSLVQVGNAYKLDDGFADISAIEYKGNEMKRWISLGNSLAVSVLSVFDGNLENPDDGDSRRRKRIWRHQ
ncbi:hypothetical protein JY97_13665 [Alkalispirochaeta odontotermitis]|nr:hypothetical protein JY97_13665 [Alkalispirochaeta odontotermitis]